MAIYGLQQLIKDSFGDVTKYRRAKCPPFLCSKLYLKNIHLSVIITMYVNFNGFTSILIRQRGNMPVNRKYGSEFYI